MLSYEPWEDDDGCDANDDDASYEKFVSRAKNLILVFRSRKVDCNSH